MNKSEDKAFLIECDYTYYCQGAEDGHGYFLVYEKTFGMAVIKLRNKYPDGMHEIWGIRNCQNRTV